MIKGTLQHIQKTSSSFGYAIEGIIWSWKNQNNYRIHIILSIMAILLAFEYEFTYFEWALLMLTISMGLVVETINSALEATLDAVDKTHRLDIKIAKDAAAASMLIFAIGSIFVAWFLFVPKILASLYL